MSTMPPPPAPQGMSTFAKWLIGCTVGCFLFMLVSCGGIIAVGHWATKKMVAQAETMSAAAKAAEQRAAEIARLDSAHAPRLPEDVAFAEIADEDIARYLRIRRELAPTMQALINTVDAIPLANPETLGGSPSFKQVVSAVKGTVAGLGQAQAAHQALLDSAALILAREGMGPTDLARMTEIVEWRYLQREEAVALGLPPFRRSEAVRLQTEVRVLAAGLVRPDGTEGLDATTRERFERELASAKERLAEIAAEAGRSVTLMDSTRAALDARRPELEALSVAGILAIAPLSGKTPWLDGIQTGGSVGAHGNWNYSSESGSPSEPSPQEDAPAPEGTSGALPGP